MNRMVILVESLVADVFTLQLKACDDTKVKFNFPWSRLQMSFQGLHNSMDMALGHSVKWH